MFIKLTDEESNEFYLNMSKVECFKYYDEYENLTQVFVEDEDEGFFLVKETPEEIMQLIKEAKNGNDL